MSASMDSECVGPVEAHSEREGSNRKESDYFPRSLQTHSQQQRWKTERLKYTDHPSMADKESLRKKAKAAWLCSPAGDVYMSDVDMGDTRLTRGSMDD